MFLTAHCGKHGYKGEVSFTSDDLHDDQRWAEKAHLLRCVLLRYEVILKANGYRKLDEHND